MFGVNVAHTVKPTNFIIIDDFNRNNSAVSMGNAKTGQQWIADNGTWGIKDNKAYVVTSTIVGQNTASCINASVNKGLISCVFNFITGQYKDQRIMFRYVDIGNHFFIRNQSTTYELIKRIGGNATGGGTTILASINRTPLNGDTVSVRLNINKIEIYINGKLETTVIDSSLQNGSKTGIACYYIEGSDMKFDNFRMVKL